MTVFIFCQNKLCLICDILATQSNDTRVTEDNKDVNIEQVVICSTQTVLDVKNIS